MLIGIHVLPTDLSMPLPRLGIECENRGFESLWVGDHTHIPVNRRTPFPAGGPLPHHYRRLLDPFVALGATAAVTERLKLGTGVCLVAQHDTIRLAKQVATLDHVSAGRLVFGVGLGWNLEEVAGHGIDPRNRRAVVRERILAMQRLWADEEAAFRGEFVSFDRSWMWPKPVTKPWPPVIFGGAAGPLLFNLISEVGDGWMPIGGSGLPAARDDLRRRFDAAGRDPDQLEITVSGVIPSPQKLEYYAEIGVHRTLCSVPSGDSATVARCLDRYCQALAQTGLTAR